MRGADDRARLSELTAESRLLGCTEVEHLGEHLAMALLQENVVRFDVAMNDALSVSLVEGARNMAEDVRRLSSRQLARFELIVEALPVEQLHDDVRRAVLHHAVVEHLHHMRALDACSRRRFAPKAFHRVVAALTKGVADELDGDLCFERCMGGDPHRAHRPVGYRSQEGHVVGDLDAWLEIHGWLQPIGLPPRRHVR